MGQSVGEIILYELLFILVAVLITDKIMVRNIIPPRRKKMRSLNLAIICGIIALGLGLALYFVNYITI